MVVTNLANIETPSSLPPSFGVPLIVPAPNGMRRVVMVPFALIDADAQTALTNAATAQTTANTAVTNAATAQTTANTANAKKQLTLIGNVSVTVNSVISLGAGVSRVSASLTGVVNGEPLFPVPHGLPLAGWDIMSAYASAANTVSVGVFNPALGIGGSGTISVDIYALR